MLNCLITLYLRARTDNPNRSTHDAYSLVEYVRNIPGFFEGDDGIVAGCPFDRDLIASLGIILKCACHDTYETAGFCGIVRSIGRTVDMGDPAKYLAKLFALPPECSAWRPGRAAALMRAKAVSYAHQFSGCPIVACLAWWVLRATRKVTCPVRLYRADEYEQERFQSARKHIRLYDTSTPPSCSPEDRDLVERRFGLEVGYQESVETALIQQERGVDVAIPQHPRLDALQFVTQLLAVEHSLACHKGAASSETRGPWRLKIPDPERELQRARECHSVCSSGGAPHYYPDKPSREQKQTCENPTNWDTFPAWLSSVRPQIPSPDEPNYQ
jgi:hypothetical protein